MQEPPTATNKKKSSQNMKTKHIKRVLKAFASKPKNEVPGGDELLEWAKAVDTKRRRSRPPKKKATV